MATASPATACVAEGEGDYLTDGRDLYVVLRLDGPRALLEDQTTPFRTREVAVKTLTRKRGWRKVGHRA